MTTLTAMTAADRPVAVRLWQLYAHDLSQFRGSFPDGAGLFKAGRLPSFFEDPDRRGYLVRHDGKLAGFALVHGVRQEPRVMGKFFVVRAARRQGVGQAAVRHGCRRVVLGGGPSTGPRQARGAARRLAPPHHLTGPPSWGVTGAARGTDPHATRPDHL